MKYQIFNIKEVNDFVLVLKSVPSITFLQSKIKWILILSSSKSHSFWSISISNQKSIYISNENMFLLYHRNSFWQRDCIDKWFSILDFPNFHWTRYQVMLRFILTPSHQWIGKLFKESTRKFNRENIWPWSRKKTITWMQDWTVQPGLKASTCNTKYFPPTLVHVFYTWLKNLNCYKKWKNYIWRLYLSYLQIL